MKITSLLSKIKLIRKRSLFVQGGNHRNTKMFTFYPDGKAQNMNLVTFHSYGNERNTNQKSLCIQLERNRVTNLLTFCSAGNEQNANLV